MIKRLALFSLTAFAACFITACTTTTPAVATSGTKPQTKEYYSEDAPGLGTNIRRRYTPGDANSPGANSVEGADLRNAQNGGSLGNQIPVTRGAGGG